MYRIQPYTGADLPPKHLCLTYDDGPGKDTYEIAKFLFEQNVPATFFVVGKYALHYPQVLEKVAEFGHLIGNHTYEHPDMPFHLSVNGDVHNQILRTDAIIKKHIIGNTVYFRSPYGKWSPEVANELNLNVLSTINHVGPIHWDIGGVDCYYWLKDETVDAAVSKYVQDINEQGRGIVVMHDEIADMNFLKEKNKTLELTKKLIPLLKEQGYKFVRLDEIASIKRDISELFRFRLKSKGKYVSLSESDYKTIIIEGGTGLVSTELSIEELGYGKVALRASNNYFFSLQENNIIGAVAKEVNANEMFDLVPFSSYQFALRAYNGNYLVREKKNGGKLLAAAAYMRGCERFTFAPVNSEIPRRRISLSERYKLLKRQLAYIKSKVQQNV